jgi:hypothetical protein
MNIAADTLIRVNPTCEVFHSSWCYSMNAMTRTNHDALPLIAVDLQRTLPITHLQDASVMCWAQLKTGVPGVQPRHWRSPFWNEPICSSCNKLSYPDVVECFCCCRQRLPEASDIQTILEDRFICKSCQAGAVHTHRQAHAHYKQILLFYSTLGMHLRYLPSLHLVRNHSLDRFAYATDVYQTRAAHARCKVKHVRGAVRMQQSSGRREDARSKQGMQIHLLSGMEAVTFGSVLAHELMHAWFSMNNFMELPVMLEEGMCELMAYLWLDTVKSEVWHSLAAAACPLECLS